MKRFALTLSLGLLAGLFLAMPAQAQEPDFDPNAPVQEYEPTSVVHPFIEVDGVQVFYYYVGDGLIRYYYLTPQGARVYYPLGWRPYRLVGGLRQFFLPTPYIFVGGQPVFYYNDGSIVRYYRYQGGRRLFLPNTWRPFRMVGGVRQFYTPRHRFNATSWNRYNSFSRPTYRPRYVQQRYRYNPVRRPVTTSHRGGNSAYRRDGASHHSQPSRTVPVRPSRTVPVQPSRTAPVRPSRTVPMRPSRTVPVQPNRTAPVRPSRTAPAQPNRQGDRGSRGDRGGRGSRDK